MDGEKNGLNPINPWMIWKYHYFRKHPVGSFRQTFRKNGVDGCGVPPLNVNVYTFFPTVRFFLGGELRFFTGVLRWGDFFLFWKEL